MACRDGAKNELDVLRFLIVHGVDIERRSIYFGTTVPTGSLDDSSTHEINQTSMEIVVRAIRYMAQSSHEPIKIYMQSYGGDPYALLYLIDTILTTPCKFVFYGGGAIMSSATWVMAVCDERYLFPHARLLFHNGSTVHVGNHTDVELRMEEEGRLQDVLEQIYAENSRMPVDFWHEICKRDLYVTADEAVLLGIADAVVPVIDRSAYRELRNKHLQQHVSPKVIKKLAKELFQRIKTPIIRSGKAKKILIGDTENVNKEDAKVSTDDKKQNPE